MLFKRSFGLMGSFFILDVHEHDRLGFGMLTVETAVIHFLILIVPIATEKVSRIRSNIIWSYLESVEEYCEGKIHMSEPESGKGNVNIVYFVNQARGNYRNQSHEFVLR